MVSRGPKSPPGHEPGSRGIELTVRRRAGGQISAQTRKRATPGGSGAASLRGAAEPTRKLRRSRADRDTSRGFALLAPRPGRPAQPRQSGNAVKDHKKNLLSFYFGLTFI